MGLGLGLVYISFAVSGEIEQFYSDTCMEQIAIDIKEFLNVEKEGLFSVEAFCLIRGLLCTFLS